MTFIPLDWQLNANYPRPEEFLGRITLAINSQSADPSWRQLSDTIGWNPYLPGQGWELSADEHLLHEGLPPLAPAAFAYHLGEKVLVYPARFVAIVQLGGQFSLARVEL